MRVTFALVSLALITAACDRQANTVAYSFRAISASEPRLIDEEYFVGDARKVLTGILASCGVNEFDALHGKSGEVSLAFEMPADRETAISGCVRQLAPKGTYLHSVHEL